MQCPVTILCVTLCDYLAPELITYSPEESDTVTLRKRRLPLEMMAW
ncbi:TPA: hypothetical protein H5081_004766 [Escherichia coli]|nr:hypothetical protein [Escherichia coli]